MTVADSVAVTLAKEVVTKLETIADGKTLERSYADWELKLEVCNELRIDVVAVSTEQQIEPAARSGASYRIPIDIAVRKRFGTDQQDDDTGRIVIEDIDALALLVEQIAEAFLEKRLENFDAGVWQETRILVNGDKKALKDMRQFIGVVRVTFRVDKDA